MMFILQAYNEQIPCIKSIKGPDYIVIHSPNGGVRTESGITDFSGYTLTDENGNPAPFEEPELDETTQLQLAIAELYEEVMKRG